jgi:hypothetical protein
MGKKYGLVKSKEPKCYPDERKRRLMLPYMEKFWRNKLVGKNKLELFYIKERN